MNYNYTWLQNKSSDGKDHTVNSFFQKNPYHYNLKTIRLISEYCGWKIVNCHDYDHDVQKMIEFKNNLNFLFNLNYKIR